MTRRNFDDAASVLSDYANAIEGHETWIEKLERLINKVAISLNIIRSYRYNIKDYGAKGDGVTDDSAAINRAIVAANAAGGGRVYAPADTYFIASTTLAMASNVRFTGDGSGKTILRCTDAGAYGSLSYMLSVGSAVSDVGIEGMTLTCSTMTSGGTTGVYLAGDNVKIRDLEILNLKIGILGKNTSRYVDIRGYKQSSTTGIAGFGILPSGVQDWTLDGIEFIGATVSIGIEKPLGFQNGGTAYGCQRVKVSNFKSDYAVAYGLGGNPDDFYPDLTATYPNPAPTWTLLFQSKTGVQASDIGKTVKQGATTIGTLLAYDDDVFPPRWTIAWASDAAADTATTITSGTTVTAKTLANNHRMKAPCTTDNLWANVDCNHGLNDLIGHGISMDACFSTHLINWSAAYNSEAGLYIGDNLCLGSTASKGTAHNNDWGIVLAASAGTSVSENDLYDNNLAGIYYAPIASGLSKNVEYSIISANNIYRNSLESTQSVDAGIGGEPSYCLFLGNNIYENRSRAVGLAGGTDNKWIGNYITDSGWGARTTLVLAGSYVNAVAGDIGKTVVGGTSGTTGTLLSYNNATKTWQVAAAGTFTALEGITITGGTGSSTSLTSATLLSPRPCVFIEGVSLRNVFEGNFIGARQTSSTVNYCVQIVTNANDNIFRNNTMVGFTVAAIDDGGLRNQDHDNLKSTDASTIANGTGYTVRTTGATLNYPTATTNTTANPALTLVNPTTGSATVALKVSGNVNTNVGSEPFNRAADFLNKHADFSSDLVRIENDGVSGAVNTTNGAYLRIGGSTPVMRVRPLSTDFGHDVKLGTAGNGLYIKEGSNATMGRAVLVAGTVTVSTTKVTTNSEIFLTRRIAGGTLGHLSIGTVTGATSFVINSSDAADTSTINWLIVEPA